MFEKIDTPSGHIAVCLGLLCLFVGLAVCGFNWAHDGYLQAQGAVYLAIQIRKSQ